MQARDPAGLTAAIYLARACYRVLVVEKEKIGGQITITEEVVNYPGIEKTDGKSLTAAMYRQAENFGAEFLMAEVEKLDVDGEYKIVHTNKGDFSCYGILLATGAHPRMIGFEGEKRFKGRGVAYCATCDGEFFTGKEIFVVGGGYAAAEESVFLTKYASHVTILIRGEDFSCPKSSADKARANEKITVLTSTEIARAEGEDVLTTLVYKNVKTGEESVYHAPKGDTFGIFVFAGYEPETSLLQGKAEIDEKGYVITDASRQTVYRVFMRLAMSARKSSSGSDGSPVMVQLQRQSLNGMWQPCRKRMEQSHHGICGKINNQRRRMLHRRKSVKECSLWSLKIPDMKCIKLDNKNSRK